MSRPRPSHPAVVTREIFWSARRTLAAACLHPRRLPAVVMVRRSLHLPAKVPCYRTPPFSELAISVSSWSQPIAAASESSSYSESRPSSCISVLLSSSRPCSENGPSQPSSSSWRRDRTTMEMFHTFATLVP
ncbi:hypothetical protein Rs2_06026 [Raphanus sativus]|nr:hypothetical protein Rs2_06026 [Raphanus sativus]